MNVGIIVFSVIFALMLEVNVVAFFFECTEWNHGPLTHLRKLWSRGKTLGKTVLVYAYIFLAPSYFLIWMIKSIVKLYYTFMDAAFEKKEPVEEEKEIHCPTYQNEEFMKLVKVVHETIRASETKEGD